ncbi:MAG: outer membrane beta-barrel protein [Armatimonas sp.]
MRSTLRLFTTLGISALAVGSALAADGDVEVGVGLELNYTHNFNRPASGQNTFLFNSREGQILLNLGEIHVSKQANMDNRVGFRLSVIDGEVARTLLRNAMFNATNPNVLEAYGAAQVNDNWLVQFGQFLSNVGAETVKVGDGQFFSRSFQYQYLQPIFGAGIRATRTVNENESWTGTITNRFRGVEDAAGNRDLFYGLQYAKTLNEKTNLKASLMTGRENMGGTVNRELNLANLVYNRSIGEENTVGADLTYRSGKEASNRRYNISGIGGYFKHDLSETRVIGLRGEYLSQSNATAGILPIGTNSVRKPTLGSITASLELKSGALPGARTLIEWRIDRASDPVFASKNGSKKTQNTLTVGQTFRF